MPTILPPSDPRLSQTEEWRGVTAHANTVATGLIGGGYIPFSARLRRFAGKLEVCGTAGDTVVEARLNGVAVSGSAVTIANTATDPTSFSVSLDVALVAGDLVTVHVTSAATGALRLLAQADFVRDY